MMYQKKIPFHCRMCGECCSGDMRVFLNPHDLEKIRNFLGIESNQRMLEEGILTLDRGQNDLMLPRIAFKRSAGILFCPFLENRIEEDGAYRGCCRLHPVMKPLVCALAPMARELNLDKGDERFYFQKPVSDCPGMKTEILYELNELFPQVEEELKREAEFFHQISRFLDEGKNREDILRCFYQFSSSNYTR